VGNESPERRWERREEREKQDEREMKWREQSGRVQGDRFVCVHVCVYRGHKSKGGNGSAESAFYSLQLLT